MNELRLTVNGEQRTAEPGTTVAGLLQAMGVDPARVAVERNRDVIPRATWGEAGLNDGDKLEIVAFIGGGLLYPVACDSALKFLEVTYSPALAFPPDEFRHGPVAVVQKGFALVTLAPNPKGRLLPLVRACRLDDHPFSSQNRDSTRYDHE